MEKSVIASNHSDPKNRPDNLTCWKSNESAQCLRVELTSGEQAIFPYGYFERARPRRC
jgi:hypothetical protein